MLNLLIPEFSYPKTVILTAYQEGAARYAQPSSTAWPSANLAIFCPIHVGSPVLVKQLFVLNGATASGNIDVGLYASDGTRITSAGSTAQAGTSAIQAFNITDIQIGSGLYYIAVALDNNTGTVEGHTFAITAGANALKTMGLAQQASAFALPATATLATITSNLLPWAGLTVNSVI